MAIERTQRITKDRKTSRTSTPRSSIGTNRPRGSERVARATPMTRESQATNNTADTKASTTLSRRSNRVATRATQRPAARSALPATNLEDSDNIALSTPRGRRSRRVSTNARSSSMALRNSRHEDAQENIEETREINPRASRRSTRSPRNLRQSISGSRMHDINSREDFSRESASISRRPISSRRDRFDAKAQAVNAPAEFNPGRGSVASTHRDNSMALSALAKRPRIASFQPNQTHGNIGSTTRFTPNQNPSQTMDFAMPQAPQVQNQFAPQNNAQLNPQSSIKNNGADTYDRSQTNANQGSSNAYNQQPSIDPLHTNSQPQGLQNQADNIKAFEANVAEQNNDINSHNDLESQLSNMQDNSEKSKANTNGNNIKPMQKKKQKKSFTMPKLIASFAILAGAGLFIVLSSTAPSVKTDKVTEINISGANNETLNIYADKTSQEPYLSRFNVNNNNAGLNAKENKFLFIARSSIHAVATTLRNFSSSYSYNVKSTRWILGSLYLSLNVSNNSSSKDTPKFHIIFLDNRGNKIDSRVIESHFEIRGKEVINANVQINNAPKGFARMFITVF